MQTPLDKKIRAFEKEQQENRTPMFGRAKDSSMGRAGYEFIIATLFFAGIGFVIDMQLETTPWITLALFFIGFATGVYNAWRAMSVDTEKVGTRYRRKPKEEIDGDPPEDGPPQP